MRMVWLKFLTNVQFYSLLGKSGKLSVLAANHQNNLLNACARFVTIDLRPIAAVGGRGLKGLFVAFGTVAHAYKEVDASDLVNCIPGADAVRSRIQKLSKDIKCELKQDLMAVFDKAGPGGAFSVDIWADRYKQQSYICISVHYITEQFELKCRTIANTYMSSKKKKVDNMFERELRKY